MEMDKNDAKVLDLIVEKIISTKEPISFNDFNEVEFLSITDMKLDETEFRRLIDIISSEGVGKITAYQFDSETTIQKNENTAKFNKRGGFTKLYQDELERKEKEEEREKLEIDLAKSNIEANELNKSIADKNDKNERKNTIGMWVNITTGVINILLIAIQILLSLQKS